MQEDEEDWRSLQEAEYETLLSTFGGEDLEITKVGGYYQGVFSAYMSLPDNGSLTVICPAAQEGEEKNDRSIEVEFLPSATLRFSMPLGYPISGVPDLNINIVWLPPHHLKKLKKELRRVCEENEGGFAIFAVFQYLQQEALDCIGFKDGKLDLSTVHKTPHICAGLFRFIIESDREQKDRRFRRETHECSLCACDKLGHEFIRFPDCGHFFCSECTLRGFELHIREGEVELVKCFACDSHLPEYQLRSLVSKEQFERIERLLLTRTLDTMTDVMECPRRECRTPVLLDLDDSLGVCSACGLAFCMHCKMTYHGVNPCQIKDMSKVVTSYTGACSSEKSRMEKMYGKRRLEKMVENHQSELYMSSSAVRCPGCTAPVEKIDGCNKMTCAKCGAYFCWLCMKKLDGRNPYGHFGSGECRGRLFQGTAGVDDMWIDLFDDFDDDEEEW